MGLLIRTGLGGIADSDWSWLTGLGGTADSDWSYLTGRGGTKRTRPTGETSIKKKENAPRLVPRWWCGKQVLLQYGAPIRPTYR